MSLRRLRPGDYLAGLAGIVLFCSIFAPWTQLSDGTEDGWRSLTFLDIWLLLASLMAILLPIITAAKDDPALPVKWDVLTAWLTLISIVLVLINVLGGAEWGGVLALGAAVASFAGAWWAMRDQSAPGLRTPPEVRAMPRPPETDPARPAT